jgi:serine/threonine-protein kinase RsbW
VKHKRACPYLHISVPSHLGYVAALRRMVSSVATHSGFNSKEAFRIETVVDELCNNAVDHAPCDQKTFEFSVKIVEDGLELEVVNTHAIPPEDVDTYVRCRMQVQNPDPASMRGRGLAIVRRLTDKLDVFFDHGKTIVRVYKKREVAANAG